MNIAIDAMGGDHAPDIVVKAAVEAAEAFGVTIFLIGNKEKINPILKGLKYSTENVVLVHTEQKVDSDDVPTSAIRQKKDASMFLGLNMVKQKKADAFVSAGNTGALLTGALLLVGRIKGVERPALAPMLPTDQGGTLLLDAGANVQCRPQQLYQFAQMGSIYMEKVMNLPSPAVGLINVGTEEGKGNDLVKDSFELLQKKADFRFVGNVEAREIPKGQVDVAVCDGFTGNVILKLYEGLGETFVNLLKGVFTTTKIGLMAALLVKKHLKAFKKKLDYTEYGGAPFLGVDGVVIKAHGSSDQKAFFHAIRQAKIFAETGVVEEIKRRV